MAVRKVKKTTSHQRKLPHSQDRRSGRKEKKKMLKEEVVIWAKKQSVQEHKDAVREQYLAQGKY